MKYLLVIVSLLCCPLGLYAQSSAVLPIDAATRRITYSEVVPVAGVSQAELYTRAKIWMASAYSSAPEVVKADEKEAGVIIIRSSTEIPMVVYGSDAAQSAWYSLVLHFKDGRYKYLVTGYHLVYATYSAPVEDALKPESRKTKAEEKQAKQYEAGIAAHAQSLINNLKASLSQSPVSADW